MKNENNEPDEITIQPDDGSNTEPAPKSTQKVARSRNKTWQANDALLRDAYINLLVANKKSPTIRMLANETNLNFKTIVKHLKSIDFETDIKPKHRLMSDAVVSALGMQAMKGKAPEAKLFLQVIENYRERSEVTGADGEAINNITVRIIKPENGS